MLRFDHMPSDFNPLFLFLGDDRDLAALAGVLRAFAEAPRSTDLNAALNAAIGRSTVTLAPGGEDGRAYGLRPSTEGGFRWFLNAWQAGQIADRIDALTLPARRSGSDIFELGVEGEIPVKVSRGEFTDDFLIHAF